VYAEGGTTAAEIPLTTNEIYNTFSNTWSTAAPMPSARFGLGVAAARCLSPQSGTCIYAVDGFNSDDLATNEAYRPASNSWSTLAPDPIKRRFPGMAAAPCPGGTIAAGCLYAIGGYKGSTPLNTNDAFSTFTNTWLTAAPMPTHRGAPAVVAARCPLGSTRTCVYAIGGFVGSYLNTNEIYNPAANTWSTGPTMPTARDGLAAAAAPCPGGSISAGCIYAIGGYNGTARVNTVEVYNTFMNTWFTETPMPTKRSELAAAAARCFSQAGTCVYAIDGRDGTVLTTNEALKA
jgi:kelch-like protein 8/kelch-like protein 20